jgi:hypothetical protein
MPPSWVAGGSHVRTRTRSHRKSLTSQRIVDRAKLVPSARNGHFRGDICLVLGEHDREAGFQVPVYVAVKEPGAHVVREESDGLRTVLLYHANP